MLDRARQALPPTLIAGVVIGLLGGAAMFTHSVIADYRHMSEVARTSREFASYGLWITTAVFFALGLRDSAARLTGLDRRLAVAAAILGALLLAPALITIYARYIERVDWRWWQGFERWSSRASFAGWLTISGLLTAIAARRAPRTVAVAGALVLFAVLAHPTDQLHRWMEIRSSHTLTLVVGFASRVGFAVALAATVAVILDGTRAPAAAPQTATIGLERTGSALIGRLMTFVFAVLFTMFAAAARSPGALQAVMGLVPAAIVTMLLVQVSGMLAIARGDRGALGVTIAAALTLWMAVVNLCQAVIAIRAALALRSPNADGVSHQMSEMAHAAQVFPSLLPAVYLVATLLLIRAVAALRAARPDLDPTPVTVARVVTVIGVCGAAILQRHGMDRVRSAGEFVLLALLIGAANVVATIAVARLCHKTAWAMKLDPEAELPTARVMS